MFLMDRLEVPNFTMVTDLVDQDCTYSLPIRSLFSGVDLDRVFVQGGSTQFTRETRLSNSTVCVQLMSLPFPVPTCLFAEEQPEISQAECSTMFGVEGVDGEFDWSAQTTSSFEKAEDYFDTKSYEYWDKIGELNSFVSYTNILDEVEINFYGLPIGTAYLCSWVNGGKVRANAFNFLGIDFPPEDDSENLQDGLYGGWIIIDGQDAKAIQTEDPEIKIRNQEINFTNSTLDEFDQWNHAYYIQPVAYRLTFQDLLCYQMSATTLGNTLSVPQPPTARGPRRMPEFDYDSLPDGEYYWGSIKSIATAVGVGGYIRLQAPTLHNFDMSAEAAIEVFDGDLTLEVLAKINCEELLNTDGSMQIGSGCVVTVGALGGLIEEGISMPGDGTLIVENERRSFKVNDDFTVSDSVVRAQTIILDDSLMIANNSSVINIDLFIGDCEFNSLLSCDIGDFRGNLDWRDMGGWRIGELYATNGDSTFLRANGKINKVYAYNLISVGGGSQLEVYEWYGVLPAVDNQSSVVSGAYYPDAPAFPDPPAQ